MRYGRRGETGDTEETLDTGEMGTQSTILRDYPVDALMSRFRYFSVSTEFIKPKMGEISNTAVRLHVYLVFVKSIEQELKIQ